MPRYMRPFEWDHDEDRCEAYDPDTGEYVGGTCDCEDRARAAYDSEVDRRIDQERDRWIDQERDREFMED